MHTNKLIALLLFIGMVSSANTTLNTSNSGLSGDAYVVEQAALGDYNYGADTAISVQSYNTATEDIRTFMMWNLSSLNGKGVTNATLAIYLYNAPTSTRTLNLYNTSITFTNGSIWIEGNKTGATAGLNEITWNNQPAAGTLQGNATTGTSDGVWLTWDITSLVNFTTANMFNNLSIVIKDSSENSGTIYTSLFTSKENATTAQRPYLNVTYDTSCPLSTLVIRAYNESNLSQSVLFDITASNSTSSFTAEDVTVLNNAFCNSSFPIGDVTISISNSSFYSPRYYYATIANNSSYSLNAYLTPLTSTYHITTSFIIISGSSVIQNALVTVQKQINGTWTTIAQKKTDSAGSAAFDLDYTVSHYVITNTTGYSVRYDYITPTSSIYYLTLSAGSSFQPFWEYYDLYNTSCTVTNLTYPSIRINCSVNDSSGHFTTAYLSVKQIGYYGSVSLCNNSSSTPNFTISCYIANPSNKTLIYTLSAATSSDPGAVVLIQNMLDYFSTTSFGNYGLLPAMMLTLTLGFAGIMLNPALGMAGVIAGIWLSNLMQLVVVGMEGLVGLTVVGIVLIYLMRT